MGSSTYVERLLYYLSPSFSPVIPVADTDLGEQSTFCTTEVRYSPLPTKSNYNNKD